MSAADELGLRGVGPIGGAWVFGSELERIADELGALRHGRGGARARARRFRGERDELLRLGRDLIRTVPMTPEYLACLSAFAKAVYRERQP